MTSAASTIQPITPELREWIIAQATAGHPPDVVLKSMMAAGWNHDSAVTALEDTLTTYLKERQAAAPLAPAPALAPTPAVLPVAISAIQPTVARSLAPTSSRQVYPPHGTRPASQPIAVPGGAVPPDMPRTAVPEPLPQGSRATLDAGDREVGVVMSLGNPRIIVFSGLMSDAECDEMIELARPSLTRSETVQVQTGGTEVNEARTSQGMFFGRGQHPVVARLEARIAKILNWPLENGEGLQILRYSPGAEYKPHYDYFDPAHSGTASILKRGGQRVASLVCYLNNPALGGHTTFPNIGLDVAPIKGNAVFFSYDRPHPATGSLHGGAPVLEGEKWVATKWLRQERFD